MEEPRERRTTRELGSDEQQRQPAEEPEDMALRDQMRTEAREEATLSGELRQAIHASELSLSAIAERACLMPLTLDDFLTGERTLRSDVIDRLANVLGCRLSQAR